MEVHGVRRWLVLAVVATAVAACRGEGGHAVYRMQQLDLFGEPRGSRFSLLAAGLQAWGKGNMARNCAVLRLAELTPSVIDSLVSQRAAGALVVLPSSQPDTGTTQTFSELLGLQVTLPVYFAHETPELLDILTAEAPSGPQLLLAGGYQAVITADKPQPLPSLPVKRLQASLPGRDKSSARTIAVVAHYDSLSIAPELSSGLRAAGSTAALLELARLFSKLYSSSRTHASYNMLFVLVGGHAINFDGSHAWLDNLAPAVADSIDFVLCLDELHDGSDLNFHVSKPPKSDTPLASLLAELQAVSATSGDSVSLVHKKINIAREDRSWEHEHFSIKRIPGATVSTRSKPRPSGEYLQAESIAGHATVPGPQLGKNVQKLAEALARHVYALNATEQGPIQVFTDALAVDPAFVDSWASYLATQSQAIQNVSSGDAILRSVQTLLKSKFLMDVSVASHTLSQQTVLFYSPTSATMELQRVKPSGFFTVVLFGVAAYLGVLYLILSNWPSAKAKQH